SAHQALADLRTQCLDLGANWIVDADVSGYFDNIDHGQLRAFLKGKVNDGALIRLIGKWLNAGVLDEGRIERPDAGTPQGGVISPILANIYLHHVLDEWMVRDVMPRLRGPCFVVRFADDFVIGWSHHHDAERVYATLPKRFGRFGLTIHPRKSQLIEFRRPFGKNGKGTGTFDFLGFTHYWGKTRQGGWTIKRAALRAAAAGAGQTDSTEVVFTYHEKDGLHRDECSELFLRGSLGTRDGCAPLVDSAVVGGGHRAVRHGHESRGHR
ncbi:MAG TPA: hypothetical protein ENJ50_09425, partial [Planctomycetaceae bacterium]|nr:hypothetical protein [Planctomycetaceae bacterium]